MAPERNRRKAGRYALAPVSGRERQEKYINENDNGYHQGLWRKRRGFLYSANTKLKVHNGIKQKCILLLNFTTTKNAAGI